MKTGRNDPCPCGSGKKYKKCCMRLEQVAGSGRTGPGRSGAERLPGAAAIRRAAAEATAWQADVVPLPTAFEADPGARPCVVMVTVMGFIVAHELLDRPSPEPEAIAEALARGFEVAMDRVEAIPGALEVRHPEVAEALAARFAALGPEDEVSEVVVRAGPMEELDEAAFEMIEGTTGVRERFLSCQPETWAAWGLPEEAVARLFAAAAAFYRAAPWRILSNLDLLEARAGTEAPGEPAPRTWAVDVMGMGGQEYGLALYSEVADFWRLVARDTSDPSTSFSGFTGQLLSLGFDPGHLLSRPMRREITRAGWEVAGSDAYPTLLTINTLAGGVRRVQAEDLIAILEAVPRFVDDHADAIEEGRPVPPQADPATGVTLTYKADMAEALRLAEPEAFSFPGPLEPLAPGCATGPGAEPEAILDQFEESVGGHFDALLEEEIQVADRFAEHLETVAGFGEATVEKHRSNAELFVRFLIDDRAVPVRAVHELHLRVFLFDWYPRKVMASATEARSMPASLKRFFAFLEEAEGISCPWAEVILAERKLFERRWESCPGHFFWDEDVIGWRVQHERDLAARAMVPDERLGEDDEWGRAMGPVEAKLVTELQNLWLLWRDEEIRAGRTLPDALREALGERQHAWETAPHPGLDGQTSPYQAIRAERKERRGSSADG